MSLEDYLEAKNLNDKYDKLTENQKTYNTLYHLLFYGETILLFSIIDFFVTENVTINEECECFEIYKITDSSNEKIGKIDANNFDEFRDAIKNVLGLSTQEDNPPKFKNNLAKQLFEKLNKHNEKRKKQTDENNTIDNMIKKYCTHNKTGINILNVWDMTYYQFKSMFEEYCNGRNYDFNDLMAANTFSYKKASDYKPMGYMQKLK